MWVRGLKSPGALSKPGELTLSHPMWVRGLKSPKSSASDH